MSRDGQDAVVMYCRTHLCLCLPRLTPSQINFMWQAWLHMFVFLFPPASPPLQPSAPHRHTHELKQLPWHWPSVVIIYSLFTHSCWWHFSNTGIVHCVWECGRERDRTRYRGRVGLTGFEKKTTQRGEERLRECKKERVRCLGRYRKHNHLLQRENNAHNAHPVAKERFYFVPRWLKGIDKIDATSFMRVLFPRQFAMFGICTANHTDFDPILLGRHY